MNTVQQALFTPSQNIVSDIVYFKKIILVLKVLFGQFDPDWRPIDLDFSGNDRIERIGNQIKNTSNINSVSEIMLKIHLNSWT